MDKKLKEICFLHGLSHPSALPQLCRSCGHHVTEVSSQQELEQHLESHDNTLILIAAEQLPPMLLGIPKWIERLMIEHPLGLFDVPRHSIDPVAWILNGSSGFIYQDERFEQSLSAVEAMLSGHLWFSRPKLEVAVQELLKKNHRLEDNNCEGIDKLTEREQSIVRLVASGASNKEIARQLFISDNTVKAHLASVFRKTETRNRVELVGKLG